MSTRSAGPVRWQRLELRVETMGCRHAVRSVTARLRDVVGVETVVADVRAGVVVVTGTMCPADVVAAIGDRPCRAAAATGASGCPECRRGQETGITVAST